MTIVRRSGQIVFGSRSSGGRPEAVVELDGDERTAALTRPKTYDMQWRAYASSMTRTLPVVRLARVPASCATGET